MYCDSRQLKPEVWGGIECTINRVKDNFRDQLEDSGHYLRDNDLEEIAALGIRTLRYPVLWEKQCRHDTDVPDWSWISPQLEKLKALHIKPIAGLVHHGSGPLGTSLMDPLFGEKLAAYAARVSEKFPWLEYYTPVNEPLTTARFSGLYGLWYPHEKDDASFCRMLYNETRATVLCMQEIRKINPNAKLVQTEDLTKIQSTRKMAYQARFENHRRWLSFDLLCGKVNPSHALWNYLTTHGIKNAELEFLLLNPCPPDIIGCNYYLTSERFLDHNFNNYPECKHAFNGKHQYADVESVRVNKLLGPEYLITEVWKRYKLPIAITEVHLHCTREEQMRWLMDVWNTACRLKQNKIDLRAITPWAMLGSFDWNSLLTLNRKCYEPGIFDVKNKRLRKTALADLIKNLATRAEFSHPVLEEEGWWKNQGTAPLILQNRKPVLLITGKTGTLGNAFEKICQIRNLPTAALTRSELNICDERSIEHAINTHHPWGIINTAGYVKVDQAEQYRDECLSINTGGAANLADACEKHGIRFMTFSSDMVFDGKKTEPYIETDQVNPLNVYGKSKAEAESKVSWLNPSALIIRSSSFFGPWDRYNFVYEILEAIRRDGKASALSDVFISPTYVPDLVNCSLDIFIDEEKGIWHISNDGVLSWADLARQAVERAGIKDDPINGISVHSLNLPAPRPRFCGLGSSNSMRLPGIEDALSRYFLDKAV